MAPAGNINMKKLLRKLSAKLVINNNNNNNNTSSFTSAAPYSLLLHLLRSLGNKLSASSGVVPAGHFPVHVGTDQEATERFLVSANLLRHPAFLDLLKISAAEFGYAQTGVLRIPVRVWLFERILESVRVGKDPKQVCNWEEDFIFCSSLTSPSSSRPCLCRSAD